MLSKQHSYNACKFIFCQMSEIDQLSVAVHNMYHCNILQRKSTVALIRQNKKYLLSQLDNTREIATMTEKVIATERVILGLIKNVSTVGEKVTGSKIAHILQRQARCRWRYSQVSSTSHISDEAMMHHKGIQVWGIRVILSQRRLSLDMIINRVL